VRQLYSPSFLWVENEYIQKKDIACKLLNEYIQKKDIACKLLNKYYLESFN